MVNIMCTAVTYETKDFYFGRTLDYEHSYHEEITITPRNYPYKFQNGITLKNHYALIGMAFVVNDYPLYYDATNEKGLSMAGLNFVGNAKYSSYAEGKDNIAQYEFISYILSTCATLKEAKEKLKNINILDKPFNEHLPVASLHWIIASKDGAITVEVMDGIVNIYDNPVGALTNNPPFDKQLFNLNNYRHLSNENPKNTFSEKLDLNSYSRGMGGIGLPGDLSSSSRFVRVSFVKMNSISPSDEENSVSQFFHILNSVDQQRGCCKLDNGEYEITIYTSCCNATKGIYYYTTYNCHQINAVNMHNENLDCVNLIRYPMITNESFNKQN